MWWQCSESTDRPLITCASVHMPRSSAERARESDPEAGVCNDYFVLYRWSVPTHATEAEVWRLWRRRRAAAEMRSRLPAVGYRADNARDGITTISVHRNICLLPSWCCRDRRRRNDSSACTTPQKCTMAGPRHLHLACTYPVFQQYPIFS